MSYLSFIEHLKFIHSVNTYLLSKDYVPGSVGDKAVNEQSICFYGDYILVKWNGGGRNIVHEVLYNSTSHSLGSLKIKK